MMVVLKLLEAEEATPLPACLPLVVSDLQFCRLFCGLCLRPVLLALHSLQPGGWWGGGGGARWVFKARMHEKVECAWVWRGGRGAASRAAVCKTGAAIGMPWPRPAYLHPRAIHSRRNYYMRHWVG